LWNTNNLSYAITGATNFNGGAAYTPADRDTLFCQFPAATGFDFLYVQTAASDGGSNTILGFNVDPSTVFSAGMKIFLTDNNGNSRLSNRLSWILTTVSSVDAGAKTITIPINTNGLTTAYTVGKTTANPVATLTVNGGPAINFDNGSIKATKLTHPAWATLTYDAATQNWLVQSDVGGNILSGLLYGWPAEICVDMANAAGAHPWLCIPTYACDSATPNIKTPAISDYTTELATYCKNNVRPGLIPRFEPSNEVWNNGQGLTHFAYRVQARRLFASYNNYENNGSNYPYGADDCYGQWLSQIGQAVSDVYGGDMTKYNVICGIQTADGLGGRLNRIASATYVHNTSVAYAPYKFTTHVSFAPYWGSGYSGSGSSFETAWATAWAAAVLANDPVTAQHYLDLNASGCTANANPYTNSYDNRSYPAPNYLGGATGAASLPWHQSKYGNLYTILDTTPGYLNNAGNKLKGCQYEGGYAGANGPFATGLLADFRNATKWSPLIASLSLADFNYFVGLGPLFEFPSTYTFTGGLSWSVFMPDTYVVPPYSTNPPRWQAILDFG
jgi:hypothetical protein